MARADSCRDGHTWYCEHQDFFTDASPSARDAQVGGDHYKSHSIQIWDIWAEYDLDPFLAMVVKYVLRAGSKGPILEDLEKARHTLDRAIEIHKEAKAGE